ncbi:hypothetical protein DXG01_007683 [Tephrocybe rancida]|nr:hypothetical protein DXG01_007683 [Tephrocybe rancida]
MDSGQDFDVDKITYDGVWNSDWGVDNIKRCSAPVEFGSLFGVYRWVWNGMINKEITNTSKLGWGGFTLSVKPARVILPANITGSFLQIDIGGTFEGLVPNQEIGPGTWDIKRTTWKIHPDDAPPPEEEGQFLWVTEALDDNGHPFVGMTIQDWEDSIGGGPWNMLGKLQADGYTYEDEDAPGMWEGSSKWEGLSGGEIERLGLVTVKEDKSLLGKRPISAVDDVEVSKSKRG